VSSDRASRSFIAAVFGLRITPRSEMKIHSRRPQGRGNQRFKDFNAMNLQVKLLLIINTRLTTALSEFF